MAQTTTKVLKMLGTLGAGGVASTLANVVSPFVAPLIYVAAGVFEHFGSELTGSVTHHLQARAWKAPHELNHDLQRLFASSIGEAVGSGLRQSYKAEITDDPLTEDEVEGLATLGGNLEKLFTPGDEIAIANLNSIELMGLLEQGAPIDRLHECFASNHVHAVDFNVEAFLLYYHFDEKKAKYIRKNILPITRIFFIEGLKSTEQASTRIAYEQMMAEETWKLLRSLKDDLQKSERQATAPPPGLEKVSAAAFSQALERMETSGELKRLLGNAITLSLDQVQAKLDDLSALEKDTNTHVKKIAVKAANIEKKVSKGLVLSYILVAIAIAGGLGAYYYFRQSTFTASISFSDENGAPLQAGNFYISYGTKRESGSIGANGLATLTEIPDRFENRSIDLLLDKNLLSEYMLDSSFRKIKLQAGGTATVVLRKQPKKQVADVTKPVEAPDNTTRQIKEESKTSPNITAAVETSLKQDIRESAEWLKISNARYAETKSSSQLDDDYIELIHQQGSTFSISGKISMNPIAATGKMKDHLLIIAQKDVRGSLRFSENWDHVSGSLEFARDGKPSPVNYGRIR